MSIPFALVYRRRAGLFLDFKERAWTMSHAEFAHCYELMSQVLFERQSDLNSRCLDKVLSLVAGETVLDAGCGKGLLSSRMAEKYAVTACDMAVDPQIRDYNSVRFCLCDVEALPFADGSFHTVVCTHTLEHVRHISIAISELRRVALTRLIIVVPKQRPYRYTFDPHLHFFPYRHTLLTIMGAASGKGQSCDEIGGDLVYVEDM